MENQIESNGQTNFGKGDATFQALGCEPGIRKVVNDFYDLMMTDAAYQTIWSWHSGDQEIMRDKLTVFLCAWTGGPRNYNAKYGSINIPAVHAHLRVQTAERDQWLNCMNAALNKNGYSKELVDYMMQQLAIPAERIRQRCEASSV